MTQNGGALLFDKWSLAVVSHCRISHCNASSGNGNGGAICCDSSSSPIITYNTISYSSANGNYCSGGGIFCANSSSPVISYNTISHNSANGGNNGFGGGISCNNSSNPVISYNTISYNYASGYYGGVGGGIFCTNANPIISYNTISYNSSGNGGGISCSGTVISSINNNTISYNTANQGGGIICSGTISSMSYNIISNNSTTTNGGGILCGSGGSITTISNCSISNNSATGNGGGFYCSGTSPTMLNVTIANNNANEGGALYCDVTAKPTLRNCILWGDTASIAGSGNEVFVNDAPSAPNFYYSDVHGGKAAFGLNGNLYTGTYTSNINANPLFVSPSGGVGTAYNGVSADWSLQYTPSISPSINTGDPNTSTPATDLAGNTRVTVCRIDQGAYENQYALPLALTTSVVNTVCGQLSTGSAAVTVTGGSSPLTYLWTPGNSTTQSISGLSAGTYSVKVTEASGCTKTATANVLANATMTYSFTPTPITCHGGNNGAVTVNVTNGVSPYTYSWSTSPVQITQTATGLSSITYSVIVTDHNGCTGTQTVSIPQPLSISLNKSRTNASCIDIDGTASVAPSGGTSPYTYLWSTTATTPSISALPSGIYSITVTDNHNCIKSDTINIKINIVAAPQPIPICAVTVDSLSKYNIIVWDKPANAPIKYFLVYRDTANNAYGLIGTVSYDSLSQFIDTVRTKYAANGDPNLSSWRYKLGLMDSCGNLSAMSPYHQSIFNQNNSGNFNWSQYQIEGQPAPVPALTNYLFQRDNSSNGNYTTIATLSASSTLFTDPQYATYQSTATWRVKTLWNISCTPTLINPKDPTINTIALNSSRSNIYRVNNPTSVNEISLNNLVSISPNPTSGMFNVQSLMANGNTSTIEIYNVMGEKVYTSVINSKSSAITLDAPNGIYFLKLRTNEGTATKKLIISK